MLARSSRRHFHPSSPSGLGLSGAPVAGDRCCSAVLAGGTLAEVLGTGRASRWGSTPRGRGSAPSPRRRRLQPKTWSSRRLRSAAGSGRSSAKNLVLG